MLNNATTPPADAASQARVSAHELTEALASIEARQAVEEFARIGTVSLAEGVSDYDVDATPEELQAEIAVLRAADAAREKIKRRQRRLRLVLISECVSAALCLLTLAGFRHTLFDKKWQEARQVKDFQWKLRSSLGPHPKYIIQTVMSSGSTTSSGQISITTTADWAGQNVYPLYALPDGYNVYHAEDLDDEGHEASPPWAYGPPETTAFVVREVGSPSSANQVSVFYDGLQYRRGRIRKTDIPNMLQGHAFAFYPAVSNSPNYDTSDMTPLTLAVQDIAEVGGHWGQAYPLPYGVILIPEGGHVHLDKHAWEPYSSSPE